MEFFTIGVYNSTEEEFFSKLENNSIDTFCDIRQRRGVRGAKYAFVNSTRLQEKLKDLGLRYQHILGLAPTKEIRELQKAADNRKGELKRTRNELGEIFSTAYGKDILERFDFKSFLLNLEKVGARRVVLFCVEEKPEACHRSLVTDALENLNYKIRHLYDGA